MTDGEFPAPGEVGEQFLHLARFPKNIGSLANPSAKGSAVGKCGDSIEVSLRIEREAITEIKVMPRGCVYTLVCASAMSELAKGRHLDQALNLRTPGCGLRPRWAAGRSSPLRPSGRQHPGRSHCRLLPHGFVRLNLHVPQSV